MTGQVKEDILCRIGELGVFVEDGKLRFNPCMLRKTEFLKESEYFSYLDVEGTTREILIPKDSICFTYCQVPVIYCISEVESIAVHYSDGRVQQHEGSQLEAVTSNEIFKRSGAINRIVASVTSGTLK